MMDLLQNIDPAHLPIIGAGCALLCVVLVVVGFLLQAIGGIVDLAVSLVELVVELLQAGPIAWCGCLLLIMFLLAAAGGVFILLNAPESCAASPTRFCHWFGFLP